MHCSKLVLVFVATAGVSVQGCGRSTPSAPSGGALTVSSISVSPSGAGLENATQFTFTANASNAGPQAAFAWQFGDGVSRTTGATATHVFTRSGTFTVQVTVSNVVGQVSTSTTVRVASLVGTWLGTVTGHTGQPIPITSFELDVSQPLGPAGVTTPLAASWADNAGCRRSNLLFGSVSHPRSVTVGAQQLSCNNGNDFYLTGTTDDQVQRITGTCTGGCQFQMTRRVP